MLHGILTSKDPLTRIALSSIGMAALVTLVKYVAYWLTGSVALYSDALESIVNVVTALATVIAIHVSKLPADKEHPFGHHKAEYLSVVLEGALIITAAVLILQESVTAFLHPHDLDKPVAGLAVSCLATALNAGWGLFLVNRGQAMNSPALAADGKHVLTDVWTSVGVIAALVLVTATGWRWLDPLMATLVAFHILATGYKLTTTSLSGLLDEAVPPQIEDLIHSAIKSSGDGALQVHDIRTRHAGRATFIEFHLVVPGEMSVADSHLICDRVEDALEDAIPGADVTIHVEPDHKAKRAGAIEIGGA